MAKTFDLVSKDYIAVTAIAGAAYSAGDEVQISDSAGFVLADVANGAKFAGVIFALGVRALKVDPTEVIAGGDKIYWDHAAKAVTATAGALTVVLGAALEGSANGETTVLISFDGTNKTYA